MRDLTDFQACYLRLRRLGYGRWTAIRLACWALDPTSKLYPENAK